MVVSMNSQSRPMGASSSQSAAALEGASLFDPCAACRLREVCDDSCGAVLEPLDSPHPLKGTFAGYRLSSNPRYGMR